ncbi:MAG: lytic murein transglycosylase, partial [Alphaproteobacteria bacterium]|nr:lytic murein transglycosylase [Alphaproteobacteria bacterium]
MKGAAWRRRARQCWLAGALVVLVLGADAAARSRFEAWLSDLAAEAQRAGIRRLTIEHALRDVEPLPRVIALDRTQPEFRLSFHEYIERVVPAARVAEARRRHAKHRSLLEALGSKYGVPPAVIVALWGIESDFGRQTGGYPVISALATLAYDGRRSAFFRAELIAALRILDGGHVAPEVMRGSWAGAMGQSQ